MKLRLRYATNRDPIGTPVRGFGPLFNPVHPHELRVGAVEVDVGGRLTGSGTAMAARITERIRSGHSKLSLYAEDLSVSPPVLGSTRLLEELKVEMDKGVATLVFIHGYNVSFDEAVGSALSLQQRQRALGLKVNVVLFSWPSDGSMLPFVAYKSDRDDAAASGLAFSRAFQKLHAYLSSMSRDQYCGGAIHLLCHSMGNFVLENTLWHLRKNVPGRLPRVFNQIVLASADVDSDAFEQESKLGRLPEIGRRITVYYNRGDEALRISDLTKGNPDRLGQSGPKHPLDAPAGVVNVDCSDAVHGLVEHSYFQDEAAGDLAATLKGTREDLIPKRKYIASANAYRLLPAK